MNKGFIAISEKLPGLSIQIAKFAIARFDFPGINLGMVCQDIFPPPLLVNFLEVNIHELVVLLIDIS